ncbi:MAG: hypothetical protein RMX68_007535 [Aulosira sp. ZfuVER01]|nr:hypothetical protein [Aulosira sp. ZfuVER01]MDZ7998873.1 hypothetical protein [Aulosira sp. DedVER01a]MDZ8053613.1 hypothetical protein [Aulosira sp. ZfuCHP01]
MDGLCLPIEQILGSCKQHIARLEQSNTTGFIEIQCRPNQGQYKVECRRGDVQNFPITSEDIVVWDAPTLPQQREPMQTSENVLVLLNSALFDTFRKHQGYATIVIFYREHDGRYGFQFMPSVIHGIKPC